MEGEGIKSGQPSEIFFTLNIIFFDRYTLRSLQPIVTAEIVKNNLHATKHVK